MKNKMKRIVFLIGFLPNPRIYKRISLAKEIGEVHLICWDRGKEMLDDPDSHDISCSIIKIEAGNDPVSRIMPYCRFSKEALKLLEDKEPDIIHVQGLDMLRIACKYKANNVNTHVIYEVADLHRLLVDKQKGLFRKIVQQLLLWQDRECSKKIDLLIVTSEFYYKSYFSSFIPKEKVLFFPNVPDLSVFKSFKKKNDNVFSIGYFGIIRYKKELLLLINAIKKFNARLIIAGYEVNGSEIEQICKTRFDIEWVGRFDFKTSAAYLYSKCDCIFAVYDSSMANCRVALPNKLYESVYCELPIIVADNTYVGDLVRKWNVGIPVQHDSEMAIDKAINELMNQKKYAELVKNCQLHKKDINLEHYNLILKQRIENVLMEKQEND